MCLDVAVKRGAECNTDHQFLCVKIRFTGSCYRRKGIVGSSGGRYDMPRLVSDGNAEDAESKQALRVEFQEQVVKRARAGTAWSMEGGMDEKWAAVSGALMKSADALLGKVRGRQPDWFRESMGTMKPQLQSRNCAYTKWLATTKEEDLARFK